MVRVQEETQIVAGLRQAFPLHDQDEAMRMALQGGAGSRDETPIFVVGLPRSGSTLVEQILASHPSVYGAGRSHLYRLVSVKGSSTSCPARTSTGQNTPGPLGLSDSSQLVVMQHGAERLQFYKQLRTLCTGAAEAGNFGEEHTGCLDVRTPNGCI